MLNLNVSMQPLALTYIKTKNQRIVMNAKLFHNASFNIF